MAVTGTNQRVLALGADGDAVTGKLKIQALAATGAVAAITDTATNPIWAAGAESSISFDKGLLIDGIVRGAGVGVLYVYLY